VPKEAQYMRVNVPTATAIPPGIQVENFRRDGGWVFSQIRNTVVREKRRAAPSAHSGTLAGSP
jgi:hypothetical protein